MVNDTSRQIQYELFLGRHRYYFRILEGIVLVITIIIRGSSILESSGKNTVLLSTQETVCLVNTVPCLFPSLNPNTLFGADNGFCWVAPPKKNRVEVTVYLSQPSKVTDITITLSHGQSEELSPFLLDVYMGPYLDTLSVSFQNRQLPRCSSATKLNFSVLPLSEPKNRLRTSVRLYDYHKSNPCIKTMTRIVKFIFKGQETESLALGKIEIFGSFSIPENSPQLDYVYYKQKRSNNLIDSIVEEFDNEGNGKFGLRDSMNLSSGYSDTDTEEYVTISISEDVQNSGFLNLQGDGYDSDFTFGGFTPERKEDDILPLPSPILPRTRSRSPSSLRNAIGSPKKFLLDASSLIEDYAGNIIKSRVSYGT